MSTKHYIHLHHLRHRRGSALVMAIILSVIITAMVIAIAWSAGTQAQSVTSFRNQDGTFYAAEAGAQRLAWYCKNNSLASITSPLTGTIDGYSYSTSWTTVSGSTIRVTSVGSLGTTSYTLYQTITPPLLSPPVFAMSGDFENKNIDVVGDVSTGGDYSNGGSGSLTGSLNYTGTASNTGSVTGTITHGSFSPINMSTLGTTLVAAAGTTFSGTQTNKTFDFTAIAGTNKVIYVNGNVSNPTFIGSGTLYVNGTVSVGGYGTSTNPVNIVASSNVTSSNNITVYGALYVGGTWSGGKIDWTGLIYVAGTHTRSNNGHSSMTQTATPWFDPRTSGGGTSTTTFTNFAGPNP